MAKLSSPRSASSASTSSEDATLAAAEHHHARPRPPARSLVPAPWQEDAVRVIGLSECREAAQSLARSFAADALSMYLLPEGKDEAGDLQAAEARWRLHVDIMTYVVAATVRKGTVTAVGPDYEGVALWLGPGCNIDSWWTTLRSGLWRMCFQLSPEGRRRYFGEVIPQLHDTKLEVLGRRDADSFYLMYIGTKPSARRQGCARKLLDHMLAQADALQCPVYLESSSPANSVYYRKFGFVTHKDLTFVRAPEPVSVSIMVREAQDVRKH